MTITHQRLGALLTTAAGAIAVAVVLAVPARAGGPSPEQLSAAGWTCFQPPVSPPIIVCANPGLGRPFPGNPDPPPAYTLMRFALDGTSLGKVHLIRADLYAGQPCAPGSDPYVFNPRIGYYECVRN